MFFTNFIDILDTISPLITLMFGVYGAVNDTKPQNGKISRSGRVALFGMVISGMITVVLKIYTYQQKFESEKIQRITEERHAKEKSRLDSLNTAFQLETANKLSRSVQELANIKSESKTISTQSKKTLTTLSDVTDKQQAVLSNTKRGLNPLFPLKIIFSYTVDINQYNKQLSPYYREMMDVYFDTLQYFARKAEIPIIVARARHNLSIPDTVNLPFVKNVDPIGEFTNPYIQYRKSYFTALYLVKGLSINLRKEKAINEADKISDNDFTISYNLGSALNQIRTNSTNWPGKISCNIDMEKKIVEVGIEADSAEIFTKNSDDFISLFDLQNSVIGIKINGLINKPGIFKLKQLSLYTGYKFSKRTDLKFADQDIAEICCGEITARRIEASEIK